MKSSRPSETRPANTTAGAIHRLIIIVSALFAAAVVSAIQPAKPIIIKMATLAPEGSPWHEVLEDIAQDWKEASDNQVQLRIYASGVVGDEADMIRKMRINQIQAAAVTAEGLSYIDKGIWGLSIPMLLKNFEELDWLREQVEPELNRRFSDKGIMVLVWADVGWVHWFAREPVRVPDDLRKQRLFTWAGDPDSERMWKAYNFQPVPLSATDVMPGLQTGLIDAISTSPLTAASFQWFALVNYMSTFRWAAMTGALIVSKGTWARIPADLRQDLLQIAKKHGQRIRDEIRYADDEAIKVMVENGLKIVATTPAEEAEWEALIEQFGSVLRGTLVEKDMFDRIMELKSVLRSKDFKMSNPDQ